MRLLRQLGYEVLEARDPDDAVAVLRGHPWPIHLVLSDVVMPGGGGQALAERLHRLRPRCASCSCRATPRSSPAGSA